MSVKQKQSKMWVSWSEEEKQKFAELVPYLRNNYKLYEKHFPNRNYNQIKSYYHNSNYKLQAQENNKRSEQQILENAIVYNQLITQISAGKLIVFKNIESSKQLSTDLTPDKDVNKQQQSDFKIPDITKFID